MPFDDRTRLISDPVRRQIYDPSTGGTKSVLQSEPVNDPRSKQIKFQNKTHF